MASPQYRRQSSARPHSYKVFHIAFSLAVKCIMAPVESNPGKLRRALHVSIFVLLGVACGVAMDIPSVMAHSPSPTGYINWEGGSIPILEKFHLVPFLDQVFRDVTLGFAPSTLGYDRVSSWQMWVFMNDIGVFYMILLLEAMRPAHKGTPIYYPAIFAMIGQLFGGGVIMPMYFFVYLVFSLPLSRQSSADKRIDVGRSLLYLPPVLLIHTIPSILMFVSETAEDRHWWVWFWQLYPVRISLGYYILIAITSFIGHPHLRSYHTTIQCIVDPFIIISVSAWVQTCLSAPYSMSEMFWLSAFGPNQPKTFNALLARILKFDQWFAFGSAYLWLIFLVVDMRQTNLITRAKVIYFLLLVALVPLLGPGAALGVMWLWRERHLVVEGDKRK